MRPTNTVNNEQQDVRGISVITPLPMGEGTGEGPVCVVVVAQSIVVIGQSVVVEGQSVVVEAQSFS